MNKEIIDFILTGTAFFCGLFSFWKILFQKNDLFKDIDDKNISIKNLSEISVIIPARNKEKSLPIRLNSLKKQTFKNFEVIVVNDSSTDNTGLIAQKYGDRILNLQSSKIQ
ncbi:MAG: glycosyltransferase family 2 protein [Candidatus Humimicrobiaceae bacterium]